MDVVHLLLAAAAAGGMAGAWGYRDSRNSERGHNSYLRGQIALLMKSEPPAPTQRAPEPRQESRAVVPTEDAARKFPALTS